MYNYIYIKSYSRLLQGSPSSFSSMAEKVLMNCKVSISVDELRVGPGLSDPPTIHDYDLVTLRQESYVVCHKEPCLGGLEGGREGKGREILYYTSIKVAVSCSFQQVCILCFIIQRGQQDHSRSTIFSCSSGMQVPMCITECDCAFSR